MADDDHAVESRGGATGVELAEGGLESPAQESGRVGDGVPRVVMEEPELEVVPDAAVAAKLVHQLRPPRRAGDGAVDEHHGDPIRTIRFQQEEAVVVSPIRRDLEQLGRRSGTKEPSQLDLPDPPSGTQLEAESLGNVFGRTLRGALAHPRAAQASGDDEVAFGSLSFLEAFLTSRRPPLPSS